VDDRIPDRSPASGSARDGLHDLAGAESDDDGSGDRRALDPFGACQSRQVCRHEEDEGARRVDEANQRYGPSSRRRYDARGSLPGTSRYHANARNDREEKHPRHYRSHPFLDVPSGHFDPRDEFSHRGDGGDGEALRSHASCVLTSHRLLFCHN